MAKSRSKFLAMHTAARACAPCAVRLRHVHGASGWLAYLACHARLQVRTLIAKLVGVVFTIAAGMIAGKEGPFVHGGGIVGGGIGALGSQTLTQLFRGRFSFKLPRRWGGFFRNDADHRDFTAIGTAAGEAPVEQLAMQDRAIAGAAFVDTQRASCCQPPPSCRCSMDKASCESYSLDHSQRFKVTGLPMDV